MDNSFEPMVDLSAARQCAEDYAALCGLTVGPPFTLSNVSFVAPLSDGSVIKVPWGGDDESLHEGDALDLWNGDGAVRVLRRSGPILIEERAVPGDDLSRLDESNAVATAVDIARRLWRPAQAPFRSVEPEVSRWLDEGQSEGGELVPLARSLFAEIRGGADWLVHGDFHHHNILRFGERFVAIDAKPYLADREYDVASFLWNPLDNRLGDRAQTRRRIAAFVDAGLDEFLIRAWTVIRGSYLRTAPEYLEPLRALIT